MSTVLNTDTVVNRVQTLTEFRTLLSQETAVSDEGFQHIIGQVATALEKSDQELADDIMVSRPTVNRWRNGRNLPHPLMRGPILHWLDRQAAAKLRLLSGSVKGRGVSTRGRARAVGGLTMRARPIAAAGKMRG